jgi:hypothetical protein
MIDIEAVKKDTVERSKPEKRQMMIFRVTIVDNDFLSYQH